MKLSIVIPAYDEEKRISKTLEEYYEFFQNKLQEDFEIIIITNNCKDNTLKVVQEFSEDKNKEQIIIFDIPSYSGKGGAVMKGFEMAKGDYIGFTDADNSTNPENFFKLYNHLNNSEKELNGVIASRKIKGARVYPRRKFRLGFSSFLFGRVVNLLFNLKIKDHQCGAKLFDKKTTKFLLGYFTEVGWHFDVDLLYLCKKNNFKILECPIFWIDSEGSHLNFFEGILSVSELFKYRLRKL